MVGLVHSAKLFWVPVDRQNVEGFGASRQPLTLRAADSHIRDLMDALAVLSSNEQNPSIACALTVDYAEGKVEIDIASRNEVTHRTQEHIRKVWKDMVEISHYSRSHGVGDGCEKKKSRVLIRSIYEFCMPTFSKNFLDNISRLHTWVSEYEKWHQEQASSKRPAWRLKMDELRSLVTAIKEILQDLSAYKDAIVMCFMMTDDETLDRFISTIDSVLDRATKLLVVDNSRVYLFGRNWGLLTRLGGIVNPYYSEHLRTSVSS